MTMMPPRAGIVYTHNEGGVANCVREEERPPTPAAISKWRRSGTSLPPAQEVDPKMSFGSGGVKASDHVVDIWRQVRPAGKPKRAARARHNKQLCTRGDSFERNSLFAAVPSLGAAAFALAVLSL